MSAKTTTRVFAAWRELYKLLSDAPFPSHPRLAQPPTIIWGDDTEPRDEAIYITGTAPDRSASTWGTYGAPSLDETFTLRIIVGTKVSGTKREETYERLEELVNVIETSLRDQTNGRPAGGFSATVPGVLHWRVANINPEIYPLPGNAGFGGYAEVDVAFTARI